MEDAPRAVDPGGRGSPKQAGCAPRYGPDGSPLALSKAGFLYCFSTVEVVPEVTSPNQRPGQTGPSWDLPTTSPLLVLPQGMESCDFSRAKFKSPSVLSSHESFDLRQSKRAWIYREGQRYPRELKASVNGQN